MPSYLAVKVSFRIESKTIFKYTYCLCFNMVSFRGQKKLGPRPYWSPLGVQFKISDEHPHLFHMRSPPPVFIRAIVDRERAIFRRRILHLSWPTDLTVTGLTVTVNFIFTLREPNVYKPHGFFLDFIFCFCVTVLFYRYLDFVVNQIKLQRQTYKISSNVPEIDRYVGYLRLV